MVTLPRRLHFPDGTERMEHVSAPFASDLTWKANACGGNEHDAMELQLAIGHRATFSWRTTLTDFRAWLERLKASPSVVSVPLGDYGAYAASMSLRLEAVAGQPDLRVVHVVALGAPTCELSWLSSREETLTMLQRLSGLADAIAQELSVHV